MSQSHALVIDDNQDNVNVLGEMLALEGMSYTAVHNPARLQSALQNLVDGVEVVFLDLEMPNLNGYQVFDMLHQTAGFERVPIVAYTVHTSEINTTRKVGFHSFLAKPLDQDEFPNQLARILRGEHVWSIAR